MRTLLLIVVLSWLMLHPDAYGPDSQVAKALLDQYGSARESAGKESHVPRVVGGVLRGRMPERNPYRRGQW